MRHSLKIAQLLPSLDIGGMERLAIDLARRQVADGHTALIYCTRYAGQLAPEAESYGVSLHAFGKTDGPSFSLVRALARKLREHRVDVLHAHNALVLHYGLFAARLARVPVVINTRHGGNLNWDPKCERIWSFATRWTDRVVFISEGVRDFYVEKDKLSLRNTRVIYNGIDVSKFSARKAQPLSHLPRFRFGAVGRLVPAKDHITLIRAFAEVSRSLPQSELHLLGDGPCRSEIERTIRNLGLVDRVSLLGGSSEVAGFLSSLDAFVLSSIDEGLPISVVEALAAGLPVISTRLPGLEELAPERVVAGYCPPAQPALLAELMLKVAGRPDLAELGSKAQQWSQRFAIEQSWHSYSALFEEALAGKNRIVTSATGRRQTIQ
jgi:glycosyltransferase involved in cell wall biosynthesis